MTAPGAGIAVADRSVPIVVFMRDRDALHHGALAIARSAGRLGIAVHAIHPDRWAPASFSRYNRGRIVCRRELTDEQWLAGLERLGRALGSAILVPLDDRGALLVNEHAELLGERFLFPRQPPGLVRLLASKRETHLLCGRLGIPVPRAQFPESEEDLEQIPEEGRFPAVLKRSEAWHASCEPAPAVIVARDPEELREAYRRMRSPAGSNVMVQEYVPGRSDCVWMLNGYFDERSECVVAFTGRKVRQRGPNRGAATLGVCEPNEAVLETTARLMKEVGYRGILDIGYRYDARDGRHKLLDVNPRIGSTFRLFVGANGVDVLRALYLDLTGQPVPAAGPSNGRKWIDEPGDLVTSIQQRRAGELTVAGWASTLRGVGEAAWFARDDLLPAAVMWLRFASTMGRRLGARLLGEREERTRHAAGGPRGGRESSQAAVDAYFESQAGFWREVYGKADVYALIHRDRRERALEWVEQLALPPGSRALEVGCGAGATAVTLARSGLQVWATDTVAAMTEQTRRHADEAGVGERLTTALADVQRLEFEDESFRLVVALGVLPWLHSPRAAIEEMARVLEEGGYLIVSADNAGRLTDLADPLLNRGLARPRGATARMLRRAGLRRARESPAKARKHSLAELDAMLRGAGLERLAGSTLGFGPFTLFGREVVPERLGVAAQTRLQAWADQDRLGLGRRGAQYLVLARRAA